jgi:hypothetical protein
MWYGSLGGPSGKFANWVHVTRVFSSAYGLKDYLQMQIASGDATTPYTSDVIIYVDNVVIRDGTPPTKAMLYSFTWPEECVPGASGAGGGAGAPTISQDFTKSPGGCLKMVVPFATDTDWQDANAELQGPAWSTTNKFTYIDFDLYLEAPAGLSTYGGFELHYWWSWTTLGSAPLSAANIGKWTHYSFVLPAGAPNGIVLHPGVWNLGPAQEFTYYIDNITLWSPAGSPTITKLEQGTPRGVQIKIDNATANWQREAIVTPGANAPRPLGFSPGWFGMTPVTYSFTITNFPDAKAHQSFEAHCYIVNGDTVTGNELNGSADWNAADIMILNVQNNDAGSVNFNLMWKTNLPGANPPGDALYHPASINNLPSALGKWSLTFTSDAAGYIKAPGGETADFTLPSDVPAANFAATTMFVQFGAFEGTDTKRNDQQSMTFSHVMITNLYGTLIEDSFAGPDLTAANDWRVTRAASITWVPEGVGQWLTWTIPDEGFSVETAGTVTGPYVDAGVTYTKVLGDKKTGAVPAANIPAGNAAFFRLKKQ